MRGPPRVPAWTRHSDGAPAHASPRALSSPRLFPRSLWKWLVAGGAGGGELAGLGCPQPGSPMGTTVSPVLPPPGPAPKAKQHRAEPLASEERPRSQDGGWRSAKTRDPANPSPPQQRSGSHPPSRPLPSVCLPPPSLSPASSPGFRHSRRVPAPYCEITPRNKKAERGGDRPSWALHPSSAGHSTGAGFSSGQRRGESRLRWVSFCF